MRDSPKYNVIIYNAPHIIYNAPYMISMFVREASLKIQWNFPCV